MKSWKKRLNEEFDAAAPALRSDVLNAPIITDDEVSLDIRSGNALLKRKIGITAAALAVAALVIAFTLMGILGVFNKKGGPDGFVFSLEINPAVAFVTDKQGVVKSVNALNDDADVILSDETTLQKLKNVPLSQAVVAFADGAARLGYLDLTQTRSAVRLSSAEGTDKTLSAAASESLRGYFMENGVYAAVVEDILTVKEFGERLGVSGAESMQSLTASLNGLSVRFGERIAPDASADILRGLYDRCVMGAQMLEMVRKELQNNLSAIIKNAKLLSQMTLCSYNILLHPDNARHADYWTIKQNPNGGYGTVFNALMEEMDGLTEEYKEEFGVTIGSSNDLIAATAAYSSLWEADFEELFSSLTPESFQSSAANFVGMLQNIGCDVTALQSLLTVPQTAKEYLTQLNEALNQLLRYRENLYMEIYQSPRAAISQADYDAFIKEITREYGSLANFWNKK